MFRCWKAGTFLGVVGGLWPILSVIPFPFSRRPSEGWDLRPRGASSPEIPAFAGMTKGVDGGRGSPQKAAVIPDWIRDP